MDETVFSAQEFENRHRRIRQRMKERSLDGLIVTRGENIYYGSGYKAAHFASWLCELHALVIPATGSPRIMTRSLEREAAKMQATEAPRLYMDHEDPYAVLLDILEESGNLAGTLGIEERFLKLSQFKRIQRVLPKAKFVDVSGMIEEVAATPSTAESECLRRAAHITQLGLDTGLRAANCRRSSRTSRVRMESRSLRTRRPSISRIRTRIGRSGCGTTWRPTERQAPGATA